MKSKNRLTATLTVLAILGLVSSNAAAAVTIKIIPVIGPATPTPQFITNVVNLYMGTSSNLVPDPNRPIIIASDTVLVSSATQTVDFNSWLGEANAAAPYDTQHGNTVYWTYDIKSSTPFTFGSIVGQLTSPFFSISNSFSGFGVSFTGQGMGVGANGITTYWSGNANTPIIEAVGIGLGWTTTAYLSDASTAQGAIDQAINSYRGYGSSFNINSIYTLNGVSQNDMLRFYIFNSVPQFTTIRAQETDVVVGGLSKMPGLTFYSLASTNPLSPKTDWVRVSTNTFAADGSFMVTNATSSRDLQRFYSVQVP